QPIAKRRIPDCHIPPLMYNAVTLSDRKFECHWCPVALDLDTELALVAQFLEELHGAARIVDVRAVDALDDIAVLQADLIENAALANREQAVADRLAAVEVRHRTDLREQLVHVVQRRVDLAAVDVVLILADLLDVRIAACGWLGACDRT